MGIRVNRCLQCLRAGLGAEGSHLSLRLAFSTGVEVESTGGLFGGFFRFVIFAGAPDLRGLGRFRASCAD